MPTQPPSPQITLIELRRLASTMNVECLDYWPISGMRFNGSQGWLIAEEDGIYLMAEETRIAKIADSWMSLSLPKAPVQTA